MRKLLLHPAAKPVVFVLCLLPLAWLVYATVANQLGANPAEALIRATGDWLSLIHIFQVARAPGKNVVYLGCALLILGVFAMLYVRERRVWVWVAPQDGRTHATMALSTNRKTMDGDQEFVQLAQKLIGASPREGTA